MNLNDDILLEYIDGSLNDDEALQVKELIDNDPRWKQRYEELKNADRLMAEIKPLTPSANFTENVMKEVSKVELARSRRFQFSRTNLKGLLVTLVGILVGIVILTVGVPEYSLVEPFLSPGQPRPPVMDAIPVHTILNSSILVKAFLFFDAVLAIFLVERFLFRPMVRNRPQRYSY